MALPALTGDASPASLSRAVTTDLLRLELGYAGVIVTDCLEMDAVAVEYGSEAGAVRALQAGADIAMVCHRIDRQRGAVEHAYAAVRDGSLSMDVLRESGRRIAALKARFAGIWDDVLNESIDAGAVRALKESNAALSQRAYAMTATLVSSTSPSPIPFRHNGPLVLVAPRTSRLNPAVDDPTLSENAIGPGYLAFARALAARKEEEKVQTVVCGPDKFDWQPSTDDAVVVFVLRDAHRHRWQLDALQRVAGAAGRIAGIVLVATSGPYDITHARAAVAEGIPCACLATFEFTAPAMEAAAAVLFGERGAPGRMPVKL
jgi:beta-N-acetylhexosaminidase